MLEREGGYVPPQEEKKIETEQTESQKFAQEFLQQENQKADQRENTLDFISAEDQRPDRMDISSVTSPNDLSPEQKTIVESTVGGPEFANLIAVAEITEKLLDSQIIDAKKAEGVVWDMLKESVERFIPQELLDKIAKQDRSFAGSMGEEGKKTLERIAGFRNGPDLEYAKLAYAVKALKYGGMMEEHAIGVFREKRELVEIKNKALKDIFEPSKEKDAYSQQVQQMELLTSRKFRDVFESGAISQETIPTMIKTTIDFFRSNPQFIRQHVPEIREAIIDLSRMGKLDEGTAKELLAETYELTK
ncbi:MAG: hypothetical protein AAB501_01980 [Patescibacteria group bacterium]